MGAKKAQMFVATAVFLTGLLFAVQQALLAYTMLDLTKPFQTDESFVATNIVDSINYTIRATDDCPEFENNLKEMLSVMRDDLSKQGYLLQTSYALNCSYWNYVPPAHSPLNITIILAGDYSSFANMKFYHIQ